MEDGETGDILKIASGGTPLKHKVELILDFKTVESFKL